jgi:hypothetical protein
MKNFYFAAAFLLLLFSCGNPPAKKTEPAVSDFTKAVQQLQRAGLLKNIPQPKLDSISKKYEQAENGLQDMLAANGDLLKINVTRNGRTFDEMYKCIADTFGMKYPELKCDELTTEIIPEKPGKHDTDWVIVKMRFGNKWYERRLYYMRKWETDDFIYRIYNRKLADEGKPERLHLVEYHCAACAKAQDDFMGTTDVTRYGYLMLTKIQEDSLLNIPLLDMEQENEFAIYTTPQMEDELKKFEASGLPSAIAAPWYENTKRTIMREAVYSKMDVYDFFDTLITRINIDTTNPFNPYEEILGSLAKISRGKFDPQQISDETENPSTQKVSFMYHGNGYSFDAQRHGAYLFPGILDDVNKALEDQHAGGAFYTIYSDASQCLVIYLEDSRVEKVKASGFFGELQKGPSKEMKDRWQNIPAVQ